MKLSIAHTPNGQQIHIVVGASETEQTSCGTLLTDLDSPELGEHQIVYQVIPPLDSPRMCPTCKRIYEDERQAIDAWNQRVLNQRVLRK